MVFESIEFWAPSFWLPPNVTWDDMDRVHGKHQNDAFYQEFLYPGTIAVAIALLRYILERYVFIPTGKYFKVKETTEKAEHNDLLEEAFEKSPSIDKNKVLRLAKQSDWTEEQVRHWWSLRRTQDQPCELYKFCESAWEGGYSIFSFTYGAILLWDKPWVWNPITWFSEMPHEVSGDIWWYYLISSSNYYALTINHLKEYKRKDFWELLIHHLVTILLLSMSRISNMQRVGAIVLILHDYGDIGLELAKMARYTGYQMLCHSLLVFYTIMWVITRLYIIPFHIVFSLFISSSLNYPVVIIMAWLLVALMVFHIFWTYRILQLIHRVFYAKKAKKDDSHQQSKSEHRTTISGIQDQSNSYQTHRSNSHK